MEENLITIQEPPNSNSEIMSGIKKERREGDKMNLPTELYEQDEVEALIGACSKRAPTGVRNRARVALLFGSGLRISEALALRPHDVDLERGIVHVRHGKGGKSRRSGLFRSAEPHLARWTAAREKLKEASIDRNQAIDKRLKIMGGADPRQLGKKLKLQGKLFLISQIYIISR